MQSGGPVALRQGAPVWAPIIAPSQTCPPEAKGCRRRDRWQPAASRGPTRPRARRKEADQASEWMALAMADSDEEELALGSLEALNKVSNAAIRVMLRDDVQELVGLQEQLNAIGEHFTNEGDMKSATYVFVLLQLTEHVYPKLAATLDGSYKEAFEKIFFMLEDSGWQLKKEGEEDEEGDEVAIECVPPSPTNWEAILALTGSDHAFLRATDDSPPPPTSYFS